MRLSSAVVWRGLSRLDNQTPIALVLTGMVQKSGNSKTGGMVQSYILVDGERPRDAIHSGADAAICGECPHRLKASGERSCYVSLRTGLGVVGRILDAGQYPTIATADAADLLRGKVLRLGTYGDPAAVPFEVWARLLAYVDGWTGYTHQWRLPSCDVRLQAYVMASADSLQDRTDARALGWRVFRVRRVTDSGAESLADDEIMCPASSEAGHKVTCDSCQLCRGRASKAKDVAIIDHSLRATAVRRRLTVVR